MCGIVGYIGKQKCIDILFAGLSRLEYRGYDSAGIAVLNGPDLGIVKAEGKLSQLKPRLAELPQSATRGIGHTRWATHGIPSTANAHPHAHENVALIHNGIIENYQELKQDLVKDGVKFQSETDTEVVLQLFYGELKQTGDARSPSAASSRSSAAPSRSASWSAPTRTTSTSSSSAARW